jgi:hypothetical protein
MLTNSMAMNEIKDSVDLVNSLLQIEKTYFHNPPRQEELNYVKGLRGGAVVLLVAAFENFIKKTIEEHLLILKTYSLNLSFEKLPVKMQIQSIFQTLEFALKGRPFQQAPDKIDRINDIDTACRQVISKTINPDAFIITGGNPNSKTIKSMFKDLGIDDIFTKIHSKFKVKWKNDVASTFIADKLDEIVNRRHIVAHTAETLNISRMDLNQYLKFIKITSQLIDAELASHVHNIRKNAAK